MRVPSWPLTRGGSWIVGFVLVCASLAPAQSGRRPTPNNPASGKPPAATDQGPSGEGQDPEVRLGTQEVLLAVTVRDAHGRPVVGLTQGEFIVAEDRVRQNLESFSDKPVPVNVVLVLDASGSIFTERKSIRQSAAEFAGQLSELDRVSVIQFADKVELIQDWTNDYESVRHALNWRYRGGEATAFWDAVYLAADQLAAVEGRRAMIILSDGVDTKSEVTHAQAQAAVDRAGAAVYVVSKAEALIEKIKPYGGVGGKIGGTSRQAQEIIAVLKTAQERMRAMADRAGGRLYAPLTDGELTTVYGQVAAELKQQYVLSYVSTNERHDGSWRNVEIFLTRPGLSARTRRGYIAE